MRDGIGSGADGAREGGDRLRILGYADGVRRIRRDEGISIGKQSTQLRKARPDPQLSNRQDRASATIGVGIDQQRVDQQRVSATDIQHGQEPCIMSEVTRRHARTARTAAATGIDAYTADTDQADTEQGGSNQPPMARAISEHGRPV